MSQQVFETTLTPINGADVKKILKSQMEKRIDKIPMLSEGNAFKRLVIGFELIMEAFPPDCPVPSAEWQILIGTPIGDDLEFDMDVRKLEVLEERLIELQANAERIIKFLKKYKTVEEIEVKESDNDTPDELRIKHGLKIPVIKTTTSGMRTETKIAHTELKK